MQTFSKIIFEQKLTTPVNAKDFNIEDYISYEHAQDCCEDCYIDFEHVDMYRWQIDSLWTIWAIKIVWVKYEWIVVYLYKNKITPDANRVWISLAARNKQNWYYNDEVILVVKINGIEF